MSSANSGFSTGIRGFQSPVSVLQPGHMGALSSQALLMGVVAAAKEHGGVIHNDTSPPVPMAPSSVQAMGQDMINATTRSVSISVP